MRNLVLIQIIVYLFISPILIYYIAGFVPSIDISLFFLIGFLIGVLLARFIVVNKNLGCEFSPPKLHIILKIFFISFSIFYIYAVVDQGLIYRRIGSETVALIAAQMPLSFKITMRVYEVIYYPMLFVTLSNLVYYKKKYIDMLLLAMFILAFLFMGVLDSRIKLIFPVIFFYVFFIAPQKKLNLLSNKKYILISMFLLSLVFYVSMSRFQVYADLDLYLLNEYVKRLDGIELISRLDNAVNIPFYGTYDYRMWSNLIAMVPFLESARELKAEGLTSSKSYFLQVILNTKEFDSNNSLVTDLYYFGGYLLTFFGAMVYGFIVMKFDRALRNKYIWKNRAILAFMCSFFINGWQFENGYTGVVVSTIRDFIILYLLFYGLVYMKINKSRRASGVV